MRSFPCRWAASSLCTRTGRAGSSGLGLSTRWALRTSHAEYEWALLLDTSARQRRSSAAHVRLPLLSGKGLRNKKKSGGEADVAPSFTACHWHAPSWFYLHLNTAILCAPGLCVCLSVVLFDQCSGNLVVVSCCACLQAMRSHCPPSKGMGVWSAVFWSASHVVHLTILAPLFTFSALLLPLLLQVLILCPLCTHCACACMLRRHASEILFPPSPFTCGPLQRVAVRIIRATRAQIDVLRTLKYPCRSA